MRRKYDFKDLEKFKYPNLVAEFMETGYSVCTLSDHMGLGRRPEDDPCVNAKIFGQEEISATEAFGLAGLFGCELDYLFDHELHVVSSYPVAYIRHMESNRQQEDEMKGRRMEKEIHEKLKNEPDLRMAVYKFVNLPEEAKRHLAHAILNNGKAPLPVE